MDQVAEDSHPAAIRLNIFFYITLTPRDLYMSLTYYSSKGGGENIHILS